MRAANPSLVVVAVALALGGCAQTGSQINVVDSHYINPEPVYDFRNSTGNGVVNAKPVPSTAATGSDDLFLSQVTAPEPERLAPATQPKPVIKAVTPVAKRDDKLVTAAVPVKVPTAAPSSEVVKTELPPILEPAAPPTYGDLMTYMPRQEAGFLELRGPVNNRLVIDQDRGKIRYQVQADSLISNVAYLLRATDAVLISDAISDKHKLPNAFWIESDTVLGLIDIMVAPFVSPHPVIARWYDNSIIELTYKDGSNG